MKKILILFTFLLSISISKANIIYVNINASGANTGASWNDAYTNLQTALILAQSGDQIWVARGTYKPTSSNISVSFTINGGISLYGGFLGNENNLSQRIAFCNETILSGDLLDNDSNNISSLQDNSRNIVSIINQSSNIIIDGFTIQKAFSNSNISNQWQVKRGGIYVWSSANVNISNCIIKNNSSYTGSGIAIYGSSANISNCIVTNNYANDDAGGMDFAFDGVINVKNCLIYNNLCDDVDSGAGSGSGVRLVHSAGSSSYPDIYNFENCTIANNLANNTTTIAGVCITNNYARARFNNCIIYGNANADLGFGEIDQLNNSAVGVNLSFSSASFSENPQFISNTDFRLSTTSPYIDAGINSLSTSLFDLYGGNRINNGTIDLGAFEYGNALPNCNSLDIPQILNIANLFSVYPNPTKDFLTIQLNNPDIENVTVSILNSLGQKIKSSSDVNNGKIILSVEDLSNGIYFISLSGNKSNTVKFIKY